MPAIQFIHFETPPLPHYIHCGYRVFKPGDSHAKRHNLGFFDLILIRSGEINIGEDGYEWCVRPGEVLILNPDRQHYPVSPCTTETGHYYIHFTAAGTSHTSTGPIPIHENNIQVEQFFISLPKYSKPQNTTRLYDLMDRLVSIRQDASVMGMWNKHILLQEILQIVSITQIQDISTARLKVAEMAATYLQKNYSHPFSGKKMSDDLNYHFGYISRCMKSIYGRSPLEYLNHFRITQAEILLMKTDFPVYAIAEMVGFNHVSYFVSLFQQQTGTSPLKYRKAFIVKPKI